jgi:hypothetical protein
MGARYLAFVFDSTDTNWPRLVLHNNGGVRFPGQEARRIWEGYRRHVNCKKDRECSYGSKQSAQANREDHRYVMMPFTERLPLMFGYRVRGDVERLGTGLLQSVL